MILTILVSPVESFAARGGGGGFSGGSAPSMPGSSGFYFSLGAKALYGTMVSSDNVAIASRNLMVYGADAVLAYKWSSVIFGAGAGYSISKQLTDPGTLSGSNLQGAQTLYSAVLGYDFGFLSLIGKYHFGASYKVDRPDAAGNQIMFAGASSPFSVQLLVPITSGGSNIGIEYTSIQYTKMTAGSVESSLDGQSQLNSSAVGVVYALVF